ncbi:MAG: hypothetical protein ACFCUM_15570 [Bacteroidales bacterium]
MIRIMESFFMVIPGIRPRTSARELQFKYLPYISFPETKITIAQQIPVYLVCSKQELP